jgi:hypothetical protein
MSPPSLQSRQLPFDRVQPPLEFVGPLLLVVGPLLFVVGPLLRLSHLPPGFVQIPLKVGR